MLPFTSRRNGVGVVEIYGPIGSGSQVSEQLKAPQHGASE